MNLKLQILALAKSLIRLLRSQLDIDPSADDILIVVADNRNKFKIVARETCRPAMFLQDSFIDCVIDVKESDIKWNSKSNLDKLKSKLEQTILKLS